MGLSAWHEGHLCFVASLWLMLRAGLISATIGMCSTTGCMVVAPWVVTPSAPTASPGQTSQALTTGTCHPICCCGVLFVPSCLLITGAIPLQFPSCWHKRWAHQLWCGAAEVAVCEGWCHTYMYAPLQWRVKKACVHHRESPANALLIWFAQSIRHKIRCFGHSD